MSVTWTITKMFRSPNYDGEQNVVRTINYNASCVKTEGDKTANASRKGEVVLNVSDLGTFTPYNDVTEAQALQWLYTALGSEKANIETALEMETDYCLNPNQISGLPWS